METHKYILKNQPRIKTFNVKALFVTVGLVAIGIISIGSLEQTASTLLIALFVTSFLILKLNIFSLFVGLLEKEEKQLMEKYTFSFI